MEREISWEEDARAPPQLPVDVAVAQGIGLGERCVRERRHARAGVDDVALEREARGVLCVVSDDLQRALLVRARVRLRENLVLDREIAALQVHARMRRRKWKYTFKVLSMQLVLKYRSRHLAAASVHAV